MTTHYLGGYYLFVLRDINFGSQKGRKSYTCSSCINESLINDWSFSWAVRSYKRERQIKKDFDITDETIKNIWRWTDAKLEEHKIGWCNVFTDIHSAEAYQHRFFSHLSTIEIMSIYFSEQERRNFFANCAPEIQYENLGPTGIYENLERGIVEEDNNQETSIGFDLIGVEISGDFHSFHCHDIAADLISRFNLQLNHWGLFDEYSDWQPVVDYMNDERNGFEPVPWFVVKVKRVLIN